MKRKELAGLMIGRAERWLLSSKDALRGERYDDAVFCAQMCAEQASKAALAVLGIEYPKVHDVSKALRAVELKLPAWFKKRLDEICFVLADLAERRGQAGYGFEEGLDVSQFKEIAPKALRQAKFALDKCKRLVESYRV